MINIDIDVQIQSKRKQNKVLIVDLKEHKEIVKRAVSGLLICAKRAGVVILYKTACNWLIIRMN